MLIQIKDIKIKKRVRKDLGDLSTLKESLKLTMKHRPDLLINRKFTKEELKLMKEIEDGIEEPKWLIDAINNAKKFM